MTLLSDSPVARHAAVPVAAPPPTSQGGPPPPRVAAEDRLALAPTFVAMLALLAGSSALTAVLRDGTWLVPLIEVLGIIWLLGVGCRLLRSPAPVTVLVQFAGLLVVLTSLFTSSGIGGLIPTSRTFHDAGALLSDAWDQILASVPPAPTTPALTFLAALAIGTTALIVDFLVAEARAPALVALPLLCLYSVPASIATDALPWWTFIAPALLYAALLATNGRLLTRRLGRASLSLVISGALIAVVGAAAGLFVGDSVTAVGTEGHLPRSAVGSGEIGLSPFTSLRGDLKRTDPVELLRVRNQPVDDYLRVVALPQWNAGSNAGFSAGTLADDGSPADGLSPVTPGSDPVPVTVESIRWASTWLPMFAGTESVSGIGDGWKYDRSLSTVYRNDSQNPHTYSVQTSFQLPTSSELRDDSVSSSDVLLDTTSIPDSVRQTAARVVSGKQNAFDKADALLKYFTTPANGFTYSLSVPAGSSGDLLADFLQSKQGYCEQYASAMTAMLRTVGVPARVAVGFTQGQLQTDGTRIITTNDAHAWVEVRFDQHGWVRFDPTPLSGDNGQQNGFTDDGSGVGAGVTPTDQGSQTEQSTSTLAPSSSVRDERQRGLRPDDGGADTSTGAAVPSSAAGATGLAAVPAFLWWTLLVLVLLVALAVVPGFLRAQRRTARLRMARAGGGGAAGAAWAEIEDLMVDHRIALVPTESTRTTANRIARTANLADSGRSKLRSLVIGAEHQWYSESSTVAVAAPEGDTLVGAVEAVRAGLHQAIPLRPLERWWPRSMRPRG